MLRSSQNSSPSPCYPSTPSARMHTQCSGCELLVSQLRSPQALLFAFDHLLSDAEFLQAIAPHLRGSGLMVLRVSMLSGTSIVKAWEAEVTSSQQPFDPKLHRQTDPSGRKNQPPKGRFGLDMPCIHLGVIYADVQSQKLRSPSHL